MPTPDQDALTWLSDFQAACRARDFDTGRRMFAQDAIAFGTWAMAVHGLDNIEREQWKNVWPRISGFTFDSKPDVRGDGDTAWIAAGWRSEATGPDGKPFTRPGRATFILARREGRWLCVHSHVSLQPTQSESAHGKLGA
jgi:ketosteroid isomerase-like protein